MSILIKGMEMPTRCAECRLSTVHSFKDRPLCDVLVEYMSYGEWEVKRLDNCPLVPVPPHGRLIDADALMKEFERAQRMMEQHGQEYSCSFLSSSREISTEWYCVEDMLENAPTIIPAEEDENGLPTPTYYFDNVIGEPIAIKAGDVQLSDKVFPEGLVKEGET